MIKYKKLPSPEELNAKGVFSLEPGLYKPRKVANASTSPGSYLTITDKGAFWILKGKQHREDGPAVEYRNGHREWYRNGVLHREDGPAIEHSEGHRYWYRNGEWHREDGPAVVYANGDREWYRNSEFYREDGGPNRELADGTREWRIGWDKPHREDGPAIERPDGSREWWRNGKLHREDGPAIERPDGSREWWRNGKLHREDGPAIIRPGFPQWWLEGLPLEISTLEELQAELTKKKRRPNPTPRKIKSKNAIKSTPNSNRSSDETEKRDGKIPVYDNFDRVLIIVGNAYWGGGVGDTFTVFQPILRFDSRNSQLISTILRSTFVFEYTFRVAMITDSNINFVSMFPGVLNVRSFFRAIGESHSVKLANSLRLHNKCNRNQNPDHDELKVISYPGEYCI